MKKTITLVLALIMMLAVASTALAASVDFKMVITSGGSSDWSNAATKDNYSTSWSVTPETSSSSYPGVSSNWIDGETVRFRARLNDNGIEDMRNLLLDQKERGKTILMASHSSEDIKCLCDNVIRMEQGRIT